MQTRLENADAFARMWKKSREDAGKTQEFMAKSLGVSKRTVQNWEDGLSCPSQLLGFEWFQILGLQPLPYYLELLYPVDEEINIENDAAIEEELIKYIKCTSNRQKRELHYMFFGNHGSSPSGVLEMITAHLHCDLRYRLNIAQNIIINYEVAKAQGHLVNHGESIPDIDVLKQSFENAKSAVKRNEKQYTNA